MTNLTNNFKRKLLTQIFFVCSILGIFFLVNKNVYASTVFSQPYNETSWSFSDDYINFPGGAIFDYPNWPTSTPIQITSAVSKYSVAQNGGNCNYFGYATGGMQIYYSANPTYTNWLSDMTVVASNSYASTTGVCYGNLNATIPSGSYIYAVIAGDYYSTSGLGILGLGSIFNSGKTADGYSNFSSLGSFAYELCDSSGCDYEYQNSYFGSSGISYINILEPENGTTTISTTINLKTEIYIPEAYTNTEIIFFLSRVEDNFNSVWQEATTYEFTGTNGINTYEENGITLEEGLYNFSVGLYDENNETVAYQSEIFTVISSAIPDSALIYSNTASGTASTLGDLMSFVNVPELLKTKKPFAYLFQIAEIFKNLDSVESESFPTGSFDINIPKGTSSTTVTVNFFSESVFDTLFTEETQAILRTILVAVTWAELAWFLYNDIKRRVF